MPVQGPLIKELRKNLKMTQAQLAEQLGVSKTSITSWECGLYSPEGENLDKLVKFFGVSADYLLGIGELKTDAAQGPAPSYKDNLGKRLTKARKKAGLNQTQLAELIGLSRYTICNWEKGRSAPGIDDLQRIADTLKIAVNSLLDAPSPASNVSNEAMAAIPVLSVETVTSCGDGAGLYGVEARPSDTIFIPAVCVAARDDLRPPFGIRVEGDSMEGAGLTEGSIAVVNPAEEVLTGDMALVVWNDRWFIKWIMWAPDGGAELRSANPVYAPIRIEKEYADNQDWFRIIGKVIKIVRIENPKKAF